MFTLLAVVGRCVLILRLDGVKIGRFDTINYIKTPLPCLVPVRQHGEVNAQDVFVVTGEIFRQTHTILNTYLK